MVTKIKREWKGFVPAQHSHPQSLCAYYKCKKAREDYRRYCAEHCAEYKSQVDDQGGADVIRFQANPSTDLA